MLQVQVNYWDLQERQRANLMSEKLRTQELNETVRSHRANEQIAWANYEEVGRHNRQMESISWYDSQTQRMMTESNIMLNSATAKLRDAQRATEEENLHQTQARTSLLEQQTKEKEKDVLWYEAGLAGSIMNSRAGMVIAGGTGAGIAKAGSWIKNVIKGQTTQEIVNRQKVAP